MKRKITALFLVLAMVLSLCACSKEEQPVTSETSAAEDQNSETFRIGKAVISYEDFYMDVTPAGDDAIVLHYRYTNRSREAAAFTDSVGYILTQGGEVMTYAAVTKPDSDVEFMDDSLSIPVDRGDTLDVYLTYALNDRETPVNIVFNNPDFTDTHGQVVEIADYPFPAPAEPEEEPALKEKLVGKYVRTDENDELVTVDIKEVGGMLLLEWGRWMGDSFYDTWAEEFWPENAEDLDSTEKTSITGESLTFSVMAMAGNYQEDAAEREITLNGEELTLAFEEDETFTRDPENHEIHTPGEQMKENLFSFYPAEEENRPAGVWSFADPVAECILNLGEDGTFLMAVKKQGQPIELTMGAWGVQTESGALSLLGETAGYGGMPGYYELEWNFSEEGNLLLKDTGTEGELLPFTEELEFISGTHLFAPELAETDIENAGGFLEAAPVETGYQKSGVYQDSFGSEFTYDFSLPVLEGDTENIRAINQAISDEFQGEIDEALASIETEGGTDLYSIGWEAGVYGGLVCIRVVKSYNYGFAVFAIYYYDAFRDQILTQDEVLEQIQISKEHFVEATRDAVQLYMEEECASLSSQQKEDYGYYDALNWTLSEDNLYYENIRVFIDEDGDIGVVLPVGSVAGADWYYRAISPDF